MATKEQPPKRKPEFTKVKNIQPAKRYNIIGMVESVSDPVTITRMDGSKVKLGTVVIGDETATVDMRVKDNQFDTVKKGQCVIQRNARSSVVKGHIMMVVDIWGKVDINMDKTKAITEVKKGKNMSEQEYEAKVEEKGE
jgi:ssDNA-binding replication factor A large subunit